MVRVLLDAGADVNQINGQGDTPLHIAGGERHVEVLHALLQAGADTTIENVDGLTPVEWVDDDLFYLFDQDEAILLDTTSSMSQKRVL